MTSGLFDCILDLVRRTPNMAVSQWGKYSDLDQGKWRDRTACARHPELPWIDDSRPDIAQEVQMAAICAQCPVRQLCAEHSLTQVGGYYAGVWFPWPPGDDLPRTVIDRVKRERERALRELRATSLMG